jgi:hypothetical protein
MNGSAVMAFLEDFHLNDSEARAAAWIAGQCSPAKTVVRFKMADLIRRTPLTRPTAYRVVHNLVEKGCVVVDNRERGGWLNVRISLTSETGAVSPVRKNRLTSETVKRSVKDAKRKRAGEASSLTHPKGLARSPVDNARRNGQPSRIASSTADLLDGLVSKLDERSPAAAEIMRARLALRAVDEPEPADLKPTDDDDAPF